MKTHIFAATLVAAGMAGINPAHAGEPAEAPGTRTDAAPKQEIRLERVTPQYWRVTLDNPPPHSRSRRSPSVQTVHEILDNDMALQRHARPKFNAAAEAAAAAHDATTRNLIEKVLADEEQHLSWLETEIALYEKLGESLYCANRLSAGGARAA
jgi:hypothetical protein